MKTYRLVTGAASGKLKMGMYMGKEHLIVPVIALVEGVIQAMNAEGPELVLASEFGRVPEAWNGRPVVLGHPQITSDRTSANHPQVMEELCFGTTFNAEMRGKKLYLEAYIDPERAEVVEGAADAVARCQAGETVEVSVGVFVAEEERGGSYEGESYVSIWRDVVPDHLAVLERGVIGACSVEMGCGTPRIAADGKEGAVSKAVAAATPEKSLLQRFMEKIQSFRPSQAGTSDNDLRRSLEKALRAVEPGFLGVDAVYPEEKYVVFAVMPEDSVLYMQCSYTETAEDGILLSSEDRMEVKPVTTFVAAKSAEAGGCGCGKAAAAPKEEKVVMAEVTPQKRARVAAVLARIAKKSQLLSCADAALVEQWEDTRIAALEAQADELETPPATPAAAAPATPVVEPPAAPAATKAQSTDEYLQSAPPEVREIVEGHRAAQTARKTELVLGLKTAQAAYTEAELTAMAVPQLEKLALVVAAGKPKTDFSGQGIPRSAGGQVNEQDVPPAPIDMDALIKSQSRYNRGKQTA